MGQQQQYEGECDGIGVGYDDEYWVVSYVVYELVDQLGVDDVVGVCCDICDGQDFVYVVGIEDFQW